LAIRRDKRNLGKIVTFRAAGSSHRARTLEGRRCQVVGFRGDVRKDVPWVMVQWESIRNPGSFQTEVDTVSGNLLHKERATRSRIAGQLRAGDYVSGSFHGGVYSEKVSGVFVATIGEQSLVAVSFGKKNRYVRLSDVKKVDGAPDGTLIKFAKRHSMYRQAVKKKRKKVVEFPERRRKEVPLQRIAGITKKKQIEFVNVIGKMAKGPQLRVTEDNLHGAAQDYVKRMVTRGKRSLYGWLIIKKTIWMARGMKIDVGHIPEHLKYHVGDDQTYDDREKE